MPRTLRQKVIFYSLFLAIGTTFLSACAGPGASISQSPARSNRAIACTGRVSVAYSANIMPTIFQVAQGLAMQIRQNLRGETLQAWPCIVTSFADIDHLESSSRFGRLLAEAVSSELFRQGAIIRDVRSAKALFVKPGSGEMILSRYAKNLAKDMNARAVIAGTYGTGATSVVVNIRMIDLDTRAVISVAMTELARTPAVEALLWTDNGKDTKKTPEPTTYDVQTF